MSYAKIVSFDEFRRIREADPEKIGRVVATSGGFDPIHFGHTTCIIDSKKYGDTLVIIVNGDNFLTAKKGKPFQSLEDRCKIVSCIRGVDYVIPFEIENDMTVCIALEKLQPDIFTKGGDRTDFSNIPEWTTCQKYGIKIIPQVGADKEWSSSDYLKNWEQFKNL